MREDKVCIARKRCDERKKFEEGFELHSAGIYTIGNCPGLGIVGLVGVRVGVPDHRNSKESKREWMC